MQISFQANYISKQAIKNVYQAHFRPASFVELDPHNAKDRDAVDKINRYWGGRSEFSQHILYEIEDGSFYRENPKRFFALTLQEKDFNNLIPEKILELAEVINAGFKRIKIKFLQVDPNNNMNDPDATFQKIGTAMLNGIKASYPSHQIILNSTEKAKRFYRAKGFKEIKDSTFLLDNGFTQSKDKFDVP